MDSIEKSKYNHDYYERTKRLKDRQDTGAVKSSGNKRSPSNSTSTTESTSSLTARISRLKSKIEVLTKALSEATAALSAQRQNDRKTIKDSSDGKSTVQEKQASQKYRDKHQTELKAKEKQDNRSSSSSGGSSSSTSSSKSASSTSVEELGSRIIKIKSALQDAKRQLSSAQQQLGQIAHSAITSDPNANANFARFRSERIPST